MKYLSTLIAALTISGCAHYQHKSPDEILPGQKDAKHVVRIIGLGCITDVFAGNDYRRLEESCRNIVNNYLTNSFTISEYLDHNLDGTDDEKCVRQGRGNQPLLKSEVWKKDRVCLDINK